MDFIVVKQFVRIRGIFNYIGTEFLLVTAKRRDKGDGYPKEYKTSYSVITREKARKIINNCGLVRTLHNEDGDVYDTPDKDFQRKYQGIISIQPHIGH